MTDVSMSTVARLHQSSTYFHAFIYFAREAPAAYEAVGCPAASGYFASRAAPMGPVPAEVVEATFYNFSTELMHGAMVGVWDAVTPADMQRARFRVVQQVLASTDLSQRLSEDDLDDAIALSQRCVDALTYPGRALAGANAAVLPMLSEDEFAGDKLLRLWQLTTIIREWRGDVHIALLVAEPLDPAECTVVSEIMTGNGGFVKGSRQWPEDMWNAAVERLTARGWVEADGTTMTPDGRAARKALEDRTDELSAAMWAGFTDTEVNRLGNYLDAGVEALTEAGRLKVLGRRPSSG